MITFTRLVATAVFVTIIACAGCNRNQPVAQNTAPVSSVASKGDQAKMKIHYLEIVTKEVDAVCAAYASSNGAEFGEPDAALGNARTAPMAGGGLLGVRAPLRDTEEPIVRPYWLVDDIEAALAAVVKAGGVVALPPMKLPGHGSCAIYVQGGVNHGLWQK